MRILALAPFFLAALGRAAVAETEALLGADNPGGSYYLYGGGLSTWVNEHSKTLRVTSRASGGSAENDRLIDTGKLDFALANAVATYRQRHGIRQFEGQRSEKVRGIAVLDTSPFHIVTYPTRGIASLADFVGRRVSIGVPGSGAATTASLLFPLAGLSGKVSIRILGFNQSAAELRDGNLDAFLVVSAMPLPAVVDLASSHQVVLLGIPSDLIECLHKENRYFEREIIPGGTYSGIAQDVETVSVASMLVASVEEPDEIVYELVRQMYTPEALIYMRRIYGAWDPKPGAALFADIEVPIHPGALRFYREHGLVK